LQRKCHRVGFFTPDKRIKEDFFGSATFGIVNKGISEIYANKDIFFFEQIEGIKLTGKYSDVLEDMKLAIQQYEIFAAIVLFGNSGNENEFIDTLNNLLECPIVGGGAAVDLRTNQTALLNEVGAQVSVLLITDEEYRIDVSFKNIHNKVISEHRLSFEDKRVLKKIDGADAAEWLENKKLQLGFNTNDYEHITFATKSGINAHLSFSDGLVKSGRDLHEIMDLRIVNKRDVLSQIQDFYHDDHAIVFGCAGLRGILPSPITSNSIGLFMFGEVCYADGRADFGNLMLSKIRFNKK
jgi:hypothetical protein